MPAGEEAQRNADEAEGHFEQYWRHASRLRIWYAAYGVGMTLCLLSHPALTGKIARDAAAMKDVFPLLAVGVAAQVLLALLNKISQYYVYLGKDRGKEDSRWYRLWGWLTEAFWIDIAADLMTLRAFAGATWLAFRVVGQAAP